MPEFVKVVDSWAIVAWVKKEPSAPMVRRFLLEAEAGDVELVMSWINVAEAFIFFRSETARPSPRNL